jgi:hypothetical protein
MITTPTDAAVRTDGDAEDLCGTVVLGAAPIGALRTACVVTAGRVAVESDAVVGEDFLGARCHAVVSMHGSSGRGIGDTDGAHAAAAAPRSMMVGEERGNRARCLRESRERG